MSNSFKVIDMIGKEALRIAHEKLTFIGTVDRQYDDSFKDNGKGKIGSTLRVREPNKYTRRQGSRVMDVQDQAESSQTITVATQDGVDMKFNSAELIQSVNSGAAFDDLSKMYIEPAVASMLSGIESDFLAYCTKATYQVAGSAGTGITTLEVPGKARAKLNQQLAPKDRRCVQFDSVTMAAVVNGTAAYFAPNKDVSERNREGFISRTAMADFYENERIWTLANNNDVTGTTDAAAQVTDGGTTVDMADTITNAAVGAVFTIAGVYDCHPETKAAYPHLKQFTVVSNASGVCTVSPATILTGAKKNVCSSTGANLATTDFNSKTLTWVGAASTSYVQPIMYHPEAFQFITADLPLMDDAQKCQRFNKDGLSVRVWMGSDIRNDELLVRLDILYGMSALRPEWACRMVGAANA
jgi:hypothetical protein